MFSGAVASSRALVDEEVVAGVVFVLARPDGSDTIFDAHGVMDIDSGEPMREDAIFRMASMTKAFTAVAALILVDEGSLSLDDEIADYLPEWANPEVLVEVDPVDPLSYTSTPAENAITVRHLLNHTAGLSYRWHGDDLTPLYQAAGITDGFEHSEMTVAEQSAALAGLPLAAEPGEAHEVSLSQDVLGRLIEVVAGQPLDEFMSERIFQPLGMTDTHFWVPESKVTRIPTLHRPSPEGGLERVDSTGENIVLGPMAYAPDYHYAGTMSYLSGGAGIACTAEDFLRFLRMLHHGGELDGVRILQPESVAAMTQNQIGEFDNTFGKYGYGVAIQDDLAAEATSGRVGSYFWGGFFYTRFWVDPQEELIGLILAQQWDPTNTRIGEVRTAVYSAIIESE